MAPRDDRSRVREFPDGARRTMDLPGTDDAPGLAPVVGQVLFMPLTMMMYGLNLLARTARAMPGVGERDYPRRVGSGQAVAPMGAAEAERRRAPPLAGPPGWSSLRPEPRRPHFEVVRQEPAPVPQQTQEPMSGERRQPQPRNSESYEPTGREEQKGMMDNKSLQDDMLKTVRYWVSFEKRDFEAVLHDDIDQVYDNLTDAQFTAWKMAEFMQRLKAGDIELPRSSGKRPFFTTHDDNGAIVLDAIAPAEQKYLTVDWEVVGRVQRRKGRFEERKTEALEKIAECCDDKGGALNIVAKP